MKPYKLKSSLYAHTADVKGLCATKDNGFVSVSRDLSAKIWNYNSENQYVEVGTVKSHKKYVNAVTVVYSISEYPDGLLITGSNDQSICIFDLKSNTLINQLVEHTGAVCSLNNTQTNLLYSGSFDCTAKIWNLADLKSTNILKSVLTLKGHTHTVWSVLSIPQHGICLTGSADKLIKQWKAGECVHTYRGHTDCVRGLATNKDYFFSCSNDGTVIQWQLNNPNPIKRYNITESFIYSIFASNNIFVTSGEDRSLRIHDSNRPANDSLLQTLVLPSQSLWNCICLPNNDIVIACSDGTVRIFTQDESRTASKAENEAFERELSAFAIPTATNETMSQINRTELPGVEALANHGKRDGQTIMINNENEIEVYSWSEVEMRWVKIGVAVGSSTAAGGSNREKVLFEGKEYDFVFDISLDDEGTSLKLPYNLSEDPWFTAQAFIHKHELSQIFLDQIAQFIITNTKGQTITSQSTSYVDPFTGEGRYTPGNSEIAASGGSHFDPFTGEGRYTPSASSIDVVPKKDSFNDPFTGGNAYRSLNQKESTKSNEYYPQPGFVLFDQKNIPPISKKIREFQAINNSDSSQIDAILNIAESESNDFSREFHALLTLLTSWSEDNVFPIIDLIRIISLKTNVQKYISLNCLEIINVLLSMKETNLTNTMLVMRVLCNLFSAFDNGINEITKYLIDNRINILAKLTRCFAMENLNKNFQNSFGTLILNYSILFNKLSGKLSSETIEEMKTELLHYICGELLNSSLYNWESEAVFRIIVCIGTLICDSPYLTTMAKSIVDLRKFCLKLETQKEKNLDKVNTCVGYLKNTIS